MTDKERDEKFEIVWDGNQPLLPPRRSYPARLWSMGGKVIIDWRDEPADKKGKDHGKGTKG